MITKSFGDYSANELYISLRDGQKAQPGGLYIQEHRRLQAHIMGIFGHSSCGGYWDKAIQQYSLTTLHNVDLTITFKDVAQVGRVPRWVGDDPYFYGGQSEYHSMTTREVELGGLEDLAQNLVLVGTQVVRLLPGSCFDADGVKWAAVNEWRDNGGVLKVEAQTGGLFSPKWAYLHDLKMRYLSCHVNGCGAIYSTDKMREDCGDAWEDSVQSNAQDIADSFVTREDAARIQADLAGVMEEYGIKGQLIDDEGNLIENKLALLMRRLRAEEATSPIMRRIFRDLDMDARPVERVLSRVVSRFSGRRVGDRAELANILVERHETEVQALYAEELERAKAGLDLMVRSEALLSPGQKTGLSRIRNKARREAAGKKW